MLRARALAHPNDAGALADLAEGELLLAGGDPSAALAAIDAALALDPESIRLRFLRATERDLHGQFDEGFADHVRVIDGKVSLSRHRPRIAGPNGHSVGSRRQRLGEWPGPQRCVLCKLR